MFSTFLIRSAPEIPLAVACPEALTSERSSVTPLLPVVVA
jgi:hypothetical protein